MDAKKLADRIRAGRMSRKMTQAELAAAVNVAPSTVGMWEQGRRIPDIENIEALADVYNVPVSYFVDDEDIIPQGGMTKRDKARLEAMHENPRLGLLFDRALNLGSDDIEFMERYVERILREREGE